MKDNLSRIMLCLAALELTDSELRRLLNDLHSMSLDEVNGRMSSLRQSAHHHVVMDDAFRYATKRSSMQFHDTSVSNRVEHLLKIQAGLSTLQAAEELTFRLIKLGLIDQHDVPPLSRKSFSNWIERVAQKVPAKEILRCATLLRNEHVHSPAMDWTLKKSE